MPEREKVISELFKFREEMRTCNNTTYVSATKKVMRMDLIDKTISLLKAQEPVEPIPGFWDRDIPLFNCGACGGEIGADGIARYLK